MLGIFDSGTGGYNALKVFREHVRYENVILLTDRLNAPYGTKSRREILEITKKNIEILKGLGARKILIACCTASTLYSRLDDEEKRISVDSLAPTAKRVRELGVKRVALIATERTVKEKAFPRLLPGVELSEIATQPLVKLIDRGATDTNMTSECRDYLLSIIPRIKAAHPEAIILGCTHFHSLRKTLKRELGIPVVSSAYEGAVAFSHAINEEIKEESRTLFLSNKY